MAEPDPFGRTKGEDPLAEMGWSDVPAAPPEVAPGATPEARPQSGGGRRSPGVLGCLPVALFFAAVLVVIAAIAIPVVSSIDDAVDSVEEVSPNLPDAPPVEAPSGPPRGLQQRSMLLRGNLSPAVRNLRARLGGRVSYVRIDAERVDVQVVNGNRLRSAQARWNREPEVFPAVSATAAGATFAWSEFDPSAPRRIARAVTRRVGKPSGAFDYAVLLDAAGLKWQVFLRDGTHFVASPDGRTIDRI